MAERGNRGVEVLGGLSLLSLAGALAAIFLYAPTERVMGIVQKIFYFHVPSAWLAYLAFFIVFVSSILYLAERARGFSISLLIRLFPPARASLRSWVKARPWDRLALSAAEIGVLFATLVLITGPLWARPVWGIWWTWDARLTTTLILWFIYVAYLVLRANIDDRERRARFSAVLGIIGFLDVPLVHFSVEWWRTTHPGPTVINPAGPSLPPEMLQTLMLSILAFTLLFFYMLLHRLRLERMRDEVEELKTALEVSGTA
ncbi:MAG: cytochrome c biogenesis protein CcsA [Chloroflexi bacterium]|nr:cytochrome c biogenesis protein CcsA [Chloroflexota bacterium]